MFTPNATAEKEVDIIDIPTDLSLKIRRRLKKINFEKMVEEENLTKTQIVKAFTKDAIPKGFKKDKDKIKEIQRIFQRWHGNFPIRNRDEKKKDYRHKINEMIKLTFSDDRMLQNFKQEMKNVIIEARMNRRETVADMATKLLAKAYPA